MTISPLRIGLVGCGYFAHYHLDAWSRVEGATVVAVVDPDPTRAALFANPHRPALANLEELLDRMEVDVVDLITPPSTHHRLAMAAAERGVHVICQKPLAPTLGEAEELVAALSQTGVRFAVHENFRWQPWYRAIRRLLDEGTTGRPFHAGFAFRVGDGWAEDAYLDRQPYFRDYPRLLFHETGVHFIDTFRFLFGEVTEVWCRTWRCNPAITGEDAGVAALTFRSGTTAIFDGSRYHESQADDPRYTFGRLRLDSESGTVRLSTDGSVTWTPLGGAAVSVLADPTKDGFAGDSVRAVQQHIIDSIRSGAPFESEGSDYLRTLAVVEACYRSAETGETIQL